MGRMPLTHRARILPGVSFPSRVVRSIIEMARLSAQSLDAFLIERRLRASTRCSTPTWSTAVTRPSRLPSGPGRPSQAWISSCARSRARESGRLVAVMGRRGYTRSARASGPWPPARRPLAPGSCRSQARPRDIRAWSHPSSDHRCRPGVAPGGEYADGAPQGDAAAGRPGGRRQSPTARGAPCVRAAGCACPPQGSGGTSRPRSAGSRPAGTACPSGSVRASPRARAGGAPVVGASAGR